MLAIGLQSELVVDNGIGGTLAPGIVLDRLAQVRGHARVRRNHFHGLRHGAATLLLAGGVSDAVVIKLMGHADTKILRRYQEVVDERQRDATRLGYADVAATW